MKISTSKGIPKSAIIRTSDWSRPSCRYRSANRGESGSGMCSTTCRRISLAPSTGGAQETSRKGGGGKLVMGRDCSSQHVPSTTAHSISCGRPTKCCSTLTLSAASSPSTSVVSDDSRGDLQAQAVSSSPGRWLTRIICSLAPMSVVLGSKLVRSST